jgi:hypothetical protein
MQLNEHGGAEHAFNLYRVRTKSGDDNTTALVYTKHEAHIPHIIAEYYPDYIMLHTPESWGRYLPQRTESFLTRFHTYFYVVGVQYDVYRANVRAWVNTPFICDICYSHDAKCIHDQMYQIVYGEFDDDVPEHEAPFNWGDI